MLTCDSNILGNKDFYKKRFVACRENRSKSDLLRTALFFFRAKHERRSLLKKFTIKKKR